MQLPSLLLDNACMNHIMGGMIAATASQQSNHSGPNLELPKCSTSVVEREIYTVPWMHSYTNVIMNIHNFHVKQHPVINYCPVTHVHVLEGLYRLFTSANSNLGG